MARIRSRFPTTSFAAAGAPLRWASVLVLIFALACATSGARRPTASPSVPARSGGDEPVAQAPEQQPEPAKSAKSSAKPGAKSDKSGDSAYESTADSKDPATADSDPTATGDDEATADDEKAEEDDGVEDLDADAKD